MGSRGIFNRPVPESFGSRSYESNGVTRGVVADQFEFMPAFDERIKSERRKEQNDLLFSIRISNTKLRSRMYQRTLFKNVGDGGT
jgi:hypothetical protein